MSRWQGKLWVVIACASVALAACGGSGSDGSAGGGSQTPSPTATAEPTPTPGGDTTVRMLERSFDPRSLTLRAGSKVTWQDIGTPERHNVVFSKDGQTDKALSHEAPIAKGAAVVTTFAAAGQYRYQCQFHSFSLTDGMVGVVLVV